MFLYGYFNEHIILVFHIDMIAQGSIHVVICNILNKD